GGFGGQGGGFGGQGGFDSETKFDDSQEDDNNR
ncbi:RNA chaperone Hfq, partial [Acinetobacter sp. ANC 4910]